MTFRQLLKRVVPVDAHTQARFDIGIRVLFYMTCANVLVLFFVQGGYDVELGPLHLHAYSLRKWLLLCFAFALSKTWLEGRRAGIPASEWIQSPLLLFLAAVCLYYSNGRVFESADTLPARFLPVSLLRDHDFYLDEFSCIIDRYKNPYPVRRINNHLVSTYPPWGAVLALPVYLAPVLRGATQLGQDVLFDLEKRAAVLITALSVLILFFALRRMTRPRVAWFIAVVYAFGTSSFSLSSQAMWQHGPSQLFLTLTLYCLVRGAATPVFLAWSGLPLGLAVICRPLNIVMALPIAVYVAHKHRDQLIGFILAGVPSLLLFLSYNAVYFGSPIQTGFGATVVSPASLVGKHLFWFSTPLAEGLAGALFSPARGLFIYSPIFLCSLAGMVLVWRKPGRVLIKYLSLASLLLLIPVATLSNWWGGHCYGPRLLADASPILCLMLCPVFEEFDQKKWLKTVAIGLAVLSVVMHAIGVAGEITWNIDLIDFDKHPERVWSWRESPPVLYGTQFFMQARQMFSELF